MKVNMNSWSSSEIINHLELYGDEHDGNIIRVLKDMSDDLDSAKEEIAEMELDDSDQIEIDRLTNENEELEEENIELQEKLDKMESEREK